MSHVSQKSLEVGSFDVESAEEVALAIIGGEFDCMYETPSARHVVDTAAHDEIIDAIGYIVMPEDTGRPQNLRTKIYAQELGKASSSFIGLRPHIDIDNKERSNPRTLIDFYFGFSSHPLDVYYGDIDIAIGDFEKHLHVVYADVPNELEQELLNQFGVVPPKSMADAVATGRLKPQQNITAGGVYLNHAGAVHNMAPIDRSVDYPPRLCIEQYLVADQPVDATQ